MNRPLSLLAAHALVLCGCYQFAWSRPVEVDPLAIPSECPDFSGRYELGEFEEQCSPFGSHGFATFRFPTLIREQQGGFAFLTPGTWLEIDQTGCELLDFTYPSRNETEQWEVEYSLELIRRRKATEIEWGSDSVRWSDRYKPVGVNFGPGVSRMALELELLESGDLGYTVESWDSGDLKDGLKCRLGRL